MKYISSALAFFISLSITHAQASQPPLLSSSDMTFSLADSGLQDAVETAVFERIKNHVEWLWISAEGVIKPNTPEEFRNFLAREVCGTIDLCNLQAKGIKTIALHSRGGNLAAGMVLGKMIRDLNLRTAIASTHRKQRGYETGSGRCFSACAYTFLGGVHRRYDFLYDPDGNLWDSYGVVGVHRFKGDGYAMARKIKETELAPPPDISSECRFRDVIDRVQCVDAVLIQYIREMGVDIGFFQIAANKGNDGLAELNLKSLRDLNVLTDDAHINWERLPWGSTFAASSTNPDPEAKVRVISAMCKDGRPSLDISIGATAEPNFTGDFSPPGKASESGVNWVADSWVFNINEKVFVVDKSDISALSDIMFFKFDAQVWKSVMDEKSINLLASPLHQNDKPLSERSKIKIIVDNFSMPLMREATTHCINNASSDNN